MKFNYFLKLLFLSFFIQTCYHDSGIISLNPPIQKLNFEKEEIFDISKDLKFVPNKFLSHLEVDFYFKNNLYFSTIQSSIWKDILPNSLINYGIGTYFIEIESNLPLDDLALRMPLISTAYSLQIDKHNIKTVGNPSETKENFIPCLKPELILLKGNNKKFLIIIHVSNFYDNNGGLWGKVLIGSKLSILNYHSMKLQLDWVYFGILLFMGLYHIGMYNIRKNDRSVLYFGVFSIIIATRSVISENRFLSHILSYEYQWIEHKIEYLSFYLAIPIFLSYLYCLFPKEFKEYFVHKINIICLLFSSIVIIFPLPIYKNTLNIFQIIFIFIGIYVFYNLYHAIINKREGIRIFLIGFSILFFSTIIDILHNLNIINFGYMATIGVISFFFSQAFLISIKFSRAFNKVEELSETLLKLNNSYSRFVPHDVLRILKKDNIMDVKLGDQIDSNITVLFSDIRDFTSLSESMSSQENFNFINSYLKRMSPTVRNNQGFIDKYIGDAIMALFPYSPENALNSSIEMQEELVIYNKDRNKFGYESIQIGIGIHTGSAMLGIIGETERMDGTVISDSVNLASRLEGLTKIYGTNIIVSETLISLVNTNSKYLFRFIDTVKVKGKQNHVNIYQLLNGMNNNSIDLILDTKKLYDEAILLYQNKKFKQSFNLFKKILHKNPEDSVSWLYLERCTKLIKSKPTHNWSPIFDHK